MVLVVDSNISRSRKGIEGISFLLDERWVLQGWFCKVVESGLLIWVRMTRQESYS